MNLEDLRRRLRSGFRPFVIRTCDGREFRVPHPGFILIAPHEVGVVSSDGYIDTLDPLHITSIRTATRNGK